MKMTPRRQRSDSAAAAVAAAQAAALGPIEPPAHVALRDGDRAFWDAVMLARARDTWTGPDLVAAGNLARCLADVERLQQRVSTEGEVIDGKLNPLCRLIETLSRRAMLLAAALHVDTISTQGRKKNAATVLALEVQARGQEADDLIPQLFKVAA